MLSSLLPRAGRSHQWGKRFDFQSAPDKKLPDRDRNADSLLQTAMSDATHTVALVGPARGSVDR